VSVLPKSVLTQLLHELPASAPTQTVQSFGGKEILLEGPYPLTVSLCEHTFVQPFFTIDDHVPNIMGMDLVQNAKLVIDSVRGYVWSYHTYGLPVNHTPAHPPRTHHHSVPSTADHANSTVSPHRRHRKRVHSLSSRCPATASTYCASSHQGTHAPHTLPPPIPICVHEQCSTVPTATFSASTSPPLANPTSLADPPTTYPPDHPLVAHQLHQATVAIIPTTERASTEPSDVLFDPASAASITNTQTDTTSLSDPAATEWLHIPSSAAASIPDPDLAVSLNHQSTNIVSPSDPAQAASLHWTASNTMPSHDSLSSGSLHSSCSHTILPADSVIAVSSSQPAIDIMSPSDLTHGSLNPCAAEFVPQPVPTTTPSCIQTVSQSLADDHVSGSPYHEPPSTAAEHSFSSSPSSETLPKTSANSDLPAHLQVLFLTTLEENKLGETVEREFKDLLLEHQHTFAKDSTDIGFCPLLQHDIDTGDAAPIKQSPRRPPLAALDAEDEILNDMLKAGVIEPSSSEWASPVCLVKKKDGTYRFCVDYRRVNAVSRRDAFPVPDIQDALDGLRGASYFATIDLLSGYWQLGMTERAKERSAFCTRRGLFQFTRLPFGLHGAPSTFCRLMSQVLSDLLWNICLCYLDDIIVYARSQEELLERLHIVLNRLREVGLKVKPSKCEFFKTQIQFLGHMVSAQGIQPLPEKVQAIHDWPKPHCLRDVRAFYGLASYYRKFVKGFANIAEPLTRLTKKGTKFIWTDDAQNAFEKLKQAVIEASTLSFPYPDVPCILDTDASDVAIGAVLSQVIGGEERPIAFFSRIMNAAQKNYCPTRRELLAVVASLQHFRHYLLGSQIILRTDHHSLKWLKTFKRPEGILARWIETLAEFSYTIEHRPGRLHCNADGVSRPLCKQCWGKVAQTPWVDELERADELVEPLSVHAVSLQPEISDTEMLQFQADDPTLAPILDMLTSDTTPTVDDLRSLPLETRNLWSQRPLVQLQQGMLVRVKDSITQLVVPTNIRKRLFDHAHGGPLSAHLGAERTLSQLQQAYYWPGMRKDIALWYKQCPDCAQSKGPPTRPHGKLTKVVTGAPLDIIAIDILSGLPQTADGTKYLLVLTDYFTKWIEAFPLPDAEASTCMRAMYDGFFSSFGLPRQIHSDQGKNFDSRLFHELCKIAGVTKTRTTPFHPRSDGQTERANRTILQMLRTAANDNPTDWPNRLPALLAAYRMTVHKVTQVTPNMAMLGREVLFPTTLIARPPEEPINTTVPFVESFKNSMRQAHEQVRAATKSTARTQKSYFDKYVKGPPFHVGQLVWLYWPLPKLRQKNKKLARLWTGPWEVVEFKTSIVVVIRHTTSQKKQTVHIDRLVPCTKTTSDCTVSPSQVQATSDNTASATVVEDIQHQTMQQPLNNNKTTTTGSTRSCRRQLPTRQRRSPSYFDNYVLS